MLSLPAQFAVVAVCAIFVLIQLAVYQENEEHYTVFDAQCSAVTDLTTQNLEGETVPVPGKIAAQCGDEQIRLSDRYSAYYFYQVLTYDQAPAIMCKKIETEYLKTTKWKCSIEGINEA